MLFWRSFEFELKEWTNGCTWIFISTNCLACKLGLLGTALTVWNIRSTLSFPFRISLLYAWRCIDYWANFRSIKLVNWIRMCFSNCEWWMLAVQVSSAFDIVMEEKLGSVRLFGCQIWGLHYVLRNYAWHRFETSKFLLQIFQRLKCTYECKADQDIYWW